MWPLMFIVVLSCEIRWCDVESCDVECGAMFMIGMWMLYVDCYVKRGVTWGGEMCAMWCVMW